MADFPAIYFDGEWRILACIPSDNNHDFPKYSSRVGFAGDSELKEIDLSWFANRIMNQGSTSSCVGHGAVAGMEIAYKQLGNPNQQFSPFFTYALINGGSDNGAMISDALKVLKKYGACPLEDMPRGVMYERQVPKKAFEQATRFKISQAYQCDSFEEVCHAISVGFTVPLGIYVGNNFGDLDSEGVSPLPRGGGGGHCILGCGLKKSTKYGWVIKIQNSWGSNWGDNGFCYIQKNHFKYMHPDAFAIQTIIDDPKDNFPQDNVPTVVN
jgi:hypothetical protein